MSKRDDLILSVGTFLINIMFFCLIITTGLFFVNIKITAVNFGLALICSICTCWFMNEKDLKKSLLVVVCGIAILGITIAICNHSYDYSWDGNTYHKTMTGFMKNGWNPLEQSFYDFADSEYEPCAMLTQTWLDAYPKGTEIFAACIYAVVGSIEAGKCFNILACIALCFISYGFLREMFPLKKYQAALCGTMCALHPVAFSQFLTYYIDGYLWQIFLLCMFCLVYMTLYKDGRLTGYCYYMLMVSIVIGLNLKFSALIYFGLPCIVFFIYWWIRARRNNRYERKEVYKRFIILVSGVILGICYVGATSYITNIIRYKNPLYTMIGEGSTELVVVQLPIVYQEMNNVTRFICSLFSKTNGSKALEHVEWKMPFTYYPEEFTAAQSCDVRTAGWGIMFSGIFIISLVVFIIALIRHREIKKEICHVMYMIFGIMIFSIVVVPGLSWARYFGAMFYLPVAAMVYLFMRYNKAKKKSGFVVAITLALLLCVDMIPNFEMAHRMLTSEYEVIKKELDDFKTITEENEVVVGYITKGRFSGRFFTLDDMDITNYTFLEAGVDETYTTLFHYYGLAYKIIE